MVTDEEAPTRDKLHAAVVTSFETRILCGELEVGEKMPAEAEIAKTFGISTRSVRDALQILETKGLVKRRHGGRAEVVRDDIGQYLASLGVTVRSLFHRDPSQLVEVMKVRRMFEVDAARQLAENRRDLAGVADALRRMEASVVARDFAAYAGADAAFHRAVVHALDNEVMSTLYDAIYQLVTDVIRLSVRVPSKPMENGLVEHTEIYAALQTGDPDKAAAALGDHIDNSTRYLMLALSRREKRTERT
ncbi:FCD domain-containing protein [Acuticoccus sp. MNP-M23]|uniref:FadR/GntR family transcriptional regulator n=1 Tax=Acuticoccus sp. MNP-M23 TaxID=3072793 RepID=UPI0028167611|nr:FCD domain-containing protein [Acuticoccus sp. MNP-M23]WMS44657.1 FCD domain-containing protein [Acuticoccus sp. MNP-M23]